MWIDVLHVTRYSQFLIFEIEVDIDLLTSDFLAILECYQASPKGFPGYLSAPNDVWSLGVVLVNLTCGRNPWKRASTEDSTFRAYLRDPGFLSSILPLSPELDSILRRIFECDPLKRITIPELRELILRCPRFTTRSNALLPTPPISEAGDYQKVTCFDEEAVIAATTAAAARIDVDPYQPSPEESSLIVVSVSPPSSPYTTLTGQYSEVEHNIECPGSSSSSSSSSSSNSDADSVFSSISSVSSTMSSTFCEPTIVKASPNSPFSYLPIQPNFCGNFLLPALDLVGKRFTPQACTFGVRVH